MATTNVSLPGTLLRLSPDTAAAPRKCRCCGQVIPKGAPLLVNSYADGRWIRKDNICMVCAPDVRTQMLDKFDKAVSEANRLAIEQQNS